MHLVQTRLDCLGVLDSIGSSWFSNCINQIYVVKLQHFSECHLLHTVLIFRSEEGFLAFEISLGNLFWLSQQTNIARLIQILKW